MRETTGVRAATREDVRAVARIHKARFCDTDKALAQFSVSLIAKFYTSFLGRFVLLVHVSERGVDGFVVGGDRKQLFDAERAFLWHNMFRCGLETLIHRRLWWKVFRFFRRLFRSPTPDFVRHLSPDLPRLLSLVVDEGTEGSGAATALIEAFESCIAEHYRGYWLAVNKKNGRALRLYERLGMTIVVDAFPDSFILQKEFEALGDDSPQEPPV